MKTLVPFTFASMLLVSACGSAGPDDMDTHAPMATPSSSSVHNYRCDSGATIVATYPSTDAATVQYQGARHDMKIAVSASGARYVGDDLEWWTKGSGPGSEGTLFQHLDDGTSGDVVERCAEF